MFIEAIPENLKSNLEILGKEQLTHQFYLAGGTALALQLGHRISNDLDFFTKNEFSSKDIPSSLKKVGYLETERIAKNTFLGRFNKVKISFFSYQYPLLFKTTPFLTISLADIRDIGAMKLDAIQGRGTKRDFIDLFALLQHGIEIQELLLCFERKYEGFNYNTYHLIKSLTYFADAEGDEMPEMLKKVKWKEVKIYIENEVKKFIKKHARP